MWNWQCDKHLKGDVNVPLRAYNRDGGGKVLKGDFRIE